MLILTILTGIVAAALLLVLGWALKRISDTLESIKGNMKNIAMGVRAIEKETELLAGVGRLNETLDGITGGARAIGEGLGSIDRNLRKIAGG